MKTSRRDFLLRSSVGAAAVASIPSIVNASIPSEKKISKNSYSIFEKGNVILFQGDSITDAGREKKKELPNNAGSFGGGYAFLAASHLLNELPEKKLSIYNRGISGNKVFQLADRWQKDCFDLKPDVLSILIGINDYWHYRNGKYDGTIETYKNDYRKLLEQTVKKLPNVKLVICQPYAVPGARVVDDSWIKPVSEFQEAAKVLANDFNTLWVPFQHVYDEAVKHAPAKYWTADGVHPAMPGAALMAEAWLKVVR